MASQNVLDVVQETLFEQFLAGSDPKLRHATATLRPHAVEDLPWWKYRRDVALWYCPWLEAYYDAGDKHFLRYDELTKTFDAVNLAELKDLAGRLRVELPEDHGELQEDEEKAETAPGENSNRCEAADAERQEVPADGGWKEQADGTEEPAADWSTDGDGNLIHVDRHAGRRFLWQEHATALGGVLFEFIAADGSAAGLRSIPRHVAIWAQSPVCVLSLLHDPQVSLCLTSSLDLGTAAPGATLLPWSSPSAAHPTARVRPSATGRWWAEAMSEDGETRVDGILVAFGALRRLRQNSVIRIGASCELLVHIPDFPGSPPEGSDVITTSSAKDGAYPPAVLRSDFVAAEPDSLPWGRQFSTGTARARELNRALKGALCLQHFSKAEQVEQHAREAQYEDQSAKRRRLHPCEWEPEAPALSAVPEAPTFSASAALYVQDTADCIRPDGSFRGSVSGHGRAGLGFHAER